MHLARSGLWEYSADKIKLGIIVSLKRKGAGYSIGKLESAWTQRRLRHDKEIRGVCCDELARVTGRVITALKMKVIYFPP
jgi:hypothetical protein